MQLAGGFCSISTGLYNRLSGHNSALKLQFSVTDTLTDALQRCAKRILEHDAPITRYYERLAAVQQRGSQASHQVLRDLLKETQTNTVPRTLLKEWVTHTFQDATDYWTFRSTVSYLDGDRATTV